MLSVSIVPCRGNPNAPEFPFDGLFGLTDVTIRGKLTVKYDQRHPNPKPVDTTSAVVRLVRIDVLNRVTVRDVVREETVWLPPAGAASVKMGEWERDFELLVPPSTPGLSRMGMMLGKVPGHSVATSWKLEAILSFPRDKPACAPPREVSLLRHSLPMQSIATTPALAWKSLAMPNSPHPIPLEYDIRIPNRPLGWKDSSDISIQFRAPSNATFCLRSIELVLSRQVTFLYGASTSTIVDDIPLDLYRAEDSPKAGATPFTTPKSTPTEEVERLVWRSPSPPERSTPSIAKSSWPLALAPGSPGYLELNTQLKFRPRPASNYRWSLGETGENKFVRISYTIRPRIAYKRSSGSFASERHLDLDHLPFRLSAVIVPERFTTFKKVQLPTVSGMRSMSERRRVDLNLCLNFADEKPLLASLAQTSSSHCKDDEHSSRPSTGRRRSEQSESLGEPARTRARTDESEPKRRPATASGIPSGFSAFVPASTTKPLSPSSTYDSLGPETPTANAFLLSAPITTATCQPHSPTSVRTGSFPLANPIARSHHAFGSSATSRPPSTRSTRSGRQPYRPRSSGTLSVASTASTTSSLADSGRFVREMSAPPAATSSSTILESSSELLGLSLSDARIESQAPRSNGLTAPIPSVSTPESSPDLSLDPPTFFAMDPTHTFDSYSIVSADKPGRNAIPRLAIDRTLVAPWHSPPLPDFEEQQSTPTEAAPVSRLGSRPNHPSQHFVRELSSATFRPSSNKRRASPPPSPPASVTGAGAHAHTTIPMGGRPSLSPESAAHSNQKRKGSVGGLLSLITRRGSKV
ncbi:uncharacterized protein JCM15063_004321 [Sporobolomyces koalae]|uniref:uncharacterized protein n=1 Tax=Sporobolomyces koalae TaxID=500713 RepID=UPI00317EA6A1